MERRTTASAKCLDHTLLFYTWFATDRVGPFVPTLQEPSMSTGGGKKALQHVILVPKGKGGSKLSVGWVDRIRNQAVIRS